VGRIRTIKPEFFSHEALYDAEKETGLPIRVAFAGLWTECDREGRFKWRPRALKAHILPYDDIDFSRVLDACLTRGLIVRYACPTRHDEKTTGEFGCIPSFLTHQLINNRETASEIPPPSEESLESYNSTRAPRVPHACPTRHDLAQGEGKGKEGEIPPPKDPPKDSQGFSPKRNSKRGGGGRPPPKKFSQNGNEHPIARAALYRATGVNPNLCSPAELDEAQKALEFLVAQYPDKSDDWIAGVVTDFGDWFFRTKRPGIVPRPRWIIEDWEKFRKFTNEWKEP
jgi:hypothetical protein